MTDVVVTSVVLEEVKKRNHSVYQRLRALCASEPKRFFVFANEHHRCGGAGAVAGWGGQGPGRRQAGGMFGGRGGAGSSVLWHSLAPQEAVAVLGGGGRVSTCHPMLRGAPTDMWELLQEGLL